MVGSAVMKQFLGDVEGIKVAIAAVAEARAQISKMEERAASEHIESEVVKIQNSVSDIIENTNRRALKCRRQLHSLKKENEQLENSENIKPSDLRMRAFVIDTLVVGFVEEIAQYQTAQLLNKRRLTAQLLKIGGNVVNDRLKNHWVQQTATPGLPDDMKKNKNPVDGDPAPSAKLATAHADKSESIETNKVGQVQTAKLDINDRLKNHWVQQTATQGLPDDMKKNKNPVDGDPAPSAKLATAHADKSKSIETSKVGQVQTAKPDVAKKESNKADAGKPNKVTSNAVCDTVNNRIKAHWMQQTEPQVVIKAKVETVEMPARTDEPDVAKKESNKADAGKPNKVTSNAVCDTVNNRIKAHWVQQTEPQVVIKAKVETVEMPARTDEPAVDKGTKQTNIVNDCLKAHWVPSEQLGKMKKPNNKDQKPKQDTEKQIDENEKTLPVSSEQLSIDYGQQIGYLMSENKCLVDEIKALRDGHAEMAKQLQTLSQKVAVMSAERDELQQSSNTKIEKLHEDLDEETLRVTFDLGLRQPSNASIEKLQDELHEETPFRASERETLDLLTRLDELNIETEGLLSEFQELAG